MFDRNGEFSFFGGIHVRTDMRINISISVRPTINKFSKQVDRVDSNETNQTGAVSAITLRSHDKLKTLYLYYQSTMTTKLGRMITHLI